MPAVRFALGVGQRVGRLIDQCAKRLRPAREQKLARVELVGQGQHAHVGILGHEQLEHFVRPAAAGGVAIEHQHDPQAIGKPLQQADLLRAQAPCPKPPPRFRIRIDGPR